MISVVDAGRVVGSAISAGATVLRAGADHLQGEFASKLALAKPPPFPITDLRLEKELFDLIDPAVGRLGLSIEEAKAEHELGQDVPFHRLPSRIGAAAVIQAPEAWLSGPDQYQVVLLIASLLQGQVAALYIYTAAVAVDPTFTDQVWPFWEMKRKFQRVRSFDRGSVARLAGQSVEDRARTLRTNLDLEEKPPAAVQLSPSEVEKIGAIMARQALAGADPQRFLRDLVDRLALEVAAHGQAVGLLVADPGATARALVGWAAGQGYPPAHERAASYTVIGYLMEAVGESCGPDDRGVLAGIVERYGLIRDRAAVARLRGN